MGKSVDISPKLCITKYTSTPMMKKHIKAPTGPVYDMAYPVPYQMEALQNVLGRGLKVNTGRYMCYPTTPPNAIICKCRFLRPRCSPSSMTLPLAAYSEDSASWIFESCLLDSAVPRAATFLSPESKDILSKCVIARQCFADSAFVSKRK